MFRPLLISLCLTSTALATTWTVDDDGKADFDNIQAAVDASSDGDEIVVMPGTYTGTGDEVVNMLGKEIWLHSSEGQGVTIIDGEGTRRGINCGNGETSNTIIEGFTITNGYNKDGGGMYTSSSSPMLTDCTFTNNTASEGGGMCNRFSSNPTLINCKFTGNVASDNAGGMYNGYNSNPILINCLFNKNTNLGFLGGGMYNSSSSPTLTDCTFTDNTANYSGGGGGGMCNRWIGSNPTLTGCTFTGNSGRDGGGVYNSIETNPTFENCTFENNTAINSGGGMFNSEFISNSSTQIGVGMCSSGSNLTLTLTGCTFTDNTAADYGGGMYNNNSSTTLTDTTLCGNNPDQIDGNWTDNGGNWVADECPTDCPDINGDGYVNVSDLLVVIDQWGLTNSPADVNSDGIVDVTDLLIVVGNWGPCE